MRHVVQQLCLLLVLTTALYAAPTTSDKSTEKEKKIPAEKVAPLPDSVKKHTKDNTGTLLAKRMQDVQKNLGHGNKAVKMPVKQFEHMNGKMGGEELKRGVLLKASLQSEGKTDKKDAKSIQSTSITGTGKGSESKMSESMYGRDQQFNGMEHAPAPHLGKIQLERYQTGPEMTPKEHLNSLSFRRGKQVEGDHADNYRMYKMAHGNSRMFGKHPSDMNGHQPNPDRWSKFDQFDRSDRSDRWGQSESGERRMRQDAPEYGISARRMYNDAYDYRKPEWMDQSKPMPMRDSYENEGSSSMSKYRDQFVPHMGDKMSFSERDWSRKRPDHGDFGGFGKQFA